MAILDIRPTQKAVKAYYETLAQYAEQRVTHESALRSAFQNLLAETAKSHNWTLIPELGAKVAGKRVRPDGTLRDQNTLPRGYWEAKDTSDDLDTEIAKKTAKGYPLTNIIFEDTQTAVLFQNKQQVVRVPLADRQKLCDLLNTFYTYTEPPIEDFNQAVKEFGSRVKELGEGLAEKIKQSHADNRRFQAAFDAFFKLCQTSLNPNIRQEAVDEMLVQHLLTERLIRTIFDKEEFTRQNIIAAEVEKVIDALVGKSFSRKEYLKSLDRFYVAIENAGRSLEDFRDKQQLLNTVYEQFFQGYSVKVADTHGIIYTPDPIVDFMCASVAEVLETEFGLSLGSPGVHILDPCTGTAKFIVNLIGRIPTPDLPRMYRNQLFANEVMLMPYYIASLNIEHAYYERTGQYEPFNGLCFVDTLDLAERRQRELFVEANTIRVEHQKKAPITVIIGNPPYNAHQINENDNNKNRPYPVIDEEIAETYTRASVASNKVALSDPYVKFFRWSSDRLGDRSGIVCFVSNNAFMNGVAFDGFRKHLLQDFDRVFHVDLKGNARTTGERRRQEAGNIFSDQIRVGVGITVLIRMPKRAAKQVFCHEVDDYMAAIEKLKHLVSFKTLSGVHWKKLSPDAAGNWASMEHQGEFSTFMPLGSRETKSASPKNNQTVFSFFSVGLKTNRDDVVYDFKRARLINRVERFIDNYNGEVDRFKRSTHKSNVDDFVRYENIKWSRDLKLDLKRGKYATFNQSKLRIGFYRPFCKKHLFFDRILNEEIYGLPRIFPTTEAEGQNMVIAFTDRGSEWPFSTLVASSIPDLHLVGVGANSSQCFPFYVYAEDGSERWENITDWALVRFREHYGDGSITKWDIFYYVYGLLHHPDYRARFADNLKRELPRIPFAPDFRAFASAGQKLARLHLDYEQIEPYRLQWLETPGMPLSYRVEDKMRLSKDKSAIIVNPSLTLAGIPRETLRYRLGNRSALEWVIDQYQVSTDKRSGIHTDPNRPDDEQYIVRLVGQVVQVSIETTRIVDSLPASFSV